MTTPGSGNQPDDNPGHGWGQQPPGGDQPQQYGQPGQPDQPGQQYGQPGQPDQPGQQFGQPGQPGQPWAGQQFGGEPPKKDKPTWQKRLPLVAAAIGVAIVLALFRDGLFGGGLPEAGDCTNDSITQLEAVDCDSDEAAFRVAGTVEDVSENELEANPDLCLTDWPNSTAFAVSETDPDEQGTGICLEPLA